MSAAAAFPLDQSVEPLLPAAYSLLHRLGIAENYKGFWYTAYAAVLTAIDQDRLLLVTKRLYPDVARHLGTSWHAVERDLRTVIDIAWNRNPVLLVSLSGGHLDNKPPCAGFLAVLSRSLRSAQLSPM